MRENTLVTQREMGGSLLENRRIWTMIRTSGHLEVVVGTLTKHTQRHGKDRCLQHETKTRTDEEDVTEKR